MKRLSFFIAAGLSLFASLYAAPAQALSLRTFVSGLGSDANNWRACYAVPDFAFAITQTAPSGEIYALDPAGYGPVTIDKAISIISAVLGAGITVPSSGTGITINAGVNDTISIRGLTIEGGGSASYGIKFNTGKSLTVEDCVIRHFSGLATAALAFLPNANSSLLVSNTLVADNGVHGISVVPNRFGTRHSRVQSRRDEQQRYGAGIYVSGTLSTGTVQVIASDSVAAGSVYGFWANSSAGHASVTFELVRCVAAHNTNAFWRTFRRCGSRRRS